ncbi:MAG: N-acetyltransferase [Gammaproteobacteria bacterium]
MTTIRQATLNDLDQLVALENQCFAADKMSRQNFRDLLTKQSAIITLATKDNNLIGSAVVLFRKNSHQARMYSLAVSPVFRKRGTAHQLCIHIEKSALARGCDTMILEVRVNNLPAIHFYQKNGYEKFAIYSKFYEDGTDALRMKKLL